MRQVKISGVPAVAVLIFLQTEIPAFHGRSQNPVTLVDGPKGKHFQNQGVWTGKQQIGQAGAVRGDNKGSVRKQSHLLSNRQILQLANAKAVSPEEAVQFFLPENHPFLGVPSGNPEPPFFTGSLDRPGEMLPEK